MLVTAHHERIHARIMDHVADDAGLPLGKEAVMARSRGGWDRSTRSRCQREGRDQIVAR
jgi:hypothetical protein